MNVTRLLVLGAIRANGRAHGYAIRQTLEDWQVQSWTRLHSGSVYHALTQLEKEGLLAVEAEAAGNRGPGKTLFVTTPAGDAEFFALLREALGSFDLIELSAGLALVDALPEAEGRERLAATAQQLRENVARLEAIAAVTPAGAGTPRTQDLLMLWGANLAASAAVLERIARG
jgi:DNA-binding PadR family transcriptional regulator